MFSGCSGQGLGPCLCGPVLWAARWTPVPTPWPRAGGLWPRLHTCLDGKQAADKHVQPGSPVRGVSPETPALRVSPVPGAPRTPAGRRHPQRLSRPPLSSGRGAHACPPRPHLPWPHGLTRSGLSWLPGRRGQTRTGDGGRAEGHALSCSLAMRSAGSPVRLICPAFRMGMSPRPRAPGRRGEAMPPPVLLRCSVAWPEPAPAPCPANLLGGVDLTVAETAEPSPRARPSRRAAPKAQGPRGGQGTEVRGGREKAGPPSPAGALHTLGL